VFSVPFFFCFKLESSTPLGRYITWLLQKDPTRGTLDNPVEDDIAHK